MPIRSQQTSSSTPQGPSREASEILNSMLVSQPEVDIERSRAREALAQPHPTENPDDDMAAAPVVASAEPHGEETRRGGRSRHDFSKREKHTKFGEYILGNTIGEGEFGKVKLGWKQEGGIQVRPINAILMCLARRERGGERCRERERAIGANQSDIGRHQTYQKGPAGQQPITNGQDHA